MSPALVALLFAAGAATWVYTKVMRSSGGNNQSSLTVAGISFVVGFIALWLILNAIDKALQ